MAVNHDWNEQQQSHDNRSSGNRIFHIFHTCYDSKGEEMSGEEMAEEKKQEALSFVTKKVLVTFFPQVALMLNDSVIMTQSAICEYRETTDNGSRVRLFDAPKELTVVSLSDGRKFTKSLHLHILNYSAITAMMELD
jgi:hypothetical protein